MNRRDFCTALGIGAVEVCVITRALAVPFVPSQTSSTPSSLSDAVWFKRMSGMRTDHMLRSKRARLFIESQFAGVTLPFYYNQTIWEGLWAFMNTPSSVMAITQPPLFSTPTPTPPVAPINITVAHNRYVTIGGYMAHGACCRAMMWIDGKSNNPEPLIVLCFVNLVGYARELWIVPNKPIGDLPPSELPHHLTMSISRWLRQRRPIASEGGLLTRLVIYDSSPEKIIPVPSAWGVKTYRCDPAMVSQAM